MRCLLFIALIVANVAHAASPEGDPRRISVVPAPATVVMSDGVFAIRASTPILIPRDRQAARVARYLADMVFRSRGVRLRVVEMEDANATNHGIVLKLDSQLEKANPEAYELDISPQDVKLSAHDARGLFYAAVTLWQLCTADVKRSDSIELPALHISDAPRFPWRGLMLDSARHYQSPEFILHFIDWMATNKLNVLQWHLTDDQGWRLEIKKYPRLTQVGAWRVPAGSGPAADIDPATGRARLHGGFYSQTDVRRIVAHAEERGVTVVPEIEMPGHASAAIVAYPELAVTANPPTKVSADWGVHSNLYNVEESTFSFLQDVLDEVIALFPSPFIHVGGDEAVKDQWRESTRVQARMREFGVANEAALQSYFIRRIERYLNAHGRRLVGWDEILDGGIAPNATVMSWRGVQGAQTAAAAGHDAVLSPAPTLYFDHLQNSDPVPGRGGIVGVEDVYRFDPLAGIVKPEERKHVLGLQGNIWTEHIRTEARVEYMTFPRATALAEVGWSAAERLDWADFSRRLPQELMRHKTLGLHDAQASAASNEDRRFRFSHQLKLCSEKIALSLEDDAPVRGARAVFWMDIMDPCWIFPAVDLGRAVQIEATVGQLPFNFQIGADAQKIPLRTPQTAYGELEVRADSCEGERIAVLPLAPAVANNGVTKLPRIRLSPRSGTHDLCFTFTRRSLDPMWALDSVRLIDR